jgi:hypothetical protein
MSDGDGDGGCVGDDDVAEDDGDDEGDDGNDDDGERMTSPRFMSSTFSRRGRETEARWTWSNRRS